VASGSIVNGGRKKGRLDIMKHLNGMHVSRQCSTCTGPWTEACEPFGPG